MAKRKGFGKYANCMGYALNRTEWLVPKDFRALLREGKRKYEFSMIEKLMRDYNLKSVARHEMVRGKEYIAFRYGQTALFENEDPDATDFHFCKRHKTGHWTHKRGSWPVEGISEKTVLDKIWINGRNVYDSEIYLFEVQSV